MFGYKFEDIPLKQKIQLLILFCIFLISLTAFISITVISKSHEKVLYRSVSSNLSYSAIEVAKYLNFTANLADTIFSDTTIQQRLPIIQDTNSPAERQLYESHIYDIISNHLFSESNQHVSYISILQEDGSSIHTYSPSFQLLPKEVKDHLITIGHLYDGATTWVTDYSQEYGLFLVKEIREAKNFSFRSLGVLIINIDPASLVSKTTAFESDYETISWLLMDGSRLLYPAEVPSDTNLKDLLKSMDTGYQIISLNGEPVFAVHGIIPGYDLDYFCAVSYDSIVHTVSNTLRLCLFALLLSIIIAFLFSSQILTSVIRHFDKLIMKMHRFGEGNYQPLENDYNYSLRKDEIGQLHTNFDAMAAKVDTLITENYVNELLKKEAQLKTLESQIDPHFLYNTLDSINWRAKAVKADDIAQITTALGNLLRISLGKTKSTFTISQEMYVVENYMTIQKLRYSKRLYFTMEIPERFHDNPIPKFTIQPLLENAVRYGLEEISEICYISVEAVSSEHCLQIEVKNNGSQFEDRLLEKLENQQLQPHGFGIGLLNIHKRLQITYGSEYGLTLYNTEDDETGEEYAIARIRLPLMKGDIPHAKTIDCR